VAKSAERGGRAGGPGLLAAVWLAVLAAVTVAVYWPGLGAPFVLDDQYFFLRDDFFTGDFASVLRQFAVRILPSASFWVDAHWHGTGAPLAWRVENVFLHAVTTGFVYLVARDVFAESRAPGARVALGAMPALAVATLFALHPLQTQAVTYVWQRQAAMVALFYVAALWAYICVCAKERLVDERGALRWTALMLVAGALAMVSKQNAVTLPLGLILVHVLATGVPPSGLRGVAPIALCAALVILPVGLGLAFGDMAQQDIQSETVRSISPASYALNEVMVVWRYVGLFFLQGKQAFVHDVAPIATVTPSVVFALGAHLAALAGALMLRHRRPRLAFGILFFYLALAPESSVIPLEDLMFEHRMYLPILGLAIALVDAMLWALEALLRARPAGPRRLRWAFGVWTVALAIPLAATTLRRNVTWTSERALWDEVAAVYPTSLRAALAVATLDMEKGDCDAALARLTKPDLDIDAAAPRVVSGALYARGRCLADKGNDGAAERALRAATGLMPSNGLAHDALAVMLARQGRFDDALIEAKLAVEHARIDLAPRLTLALILEDLGRKDEALAAVRDAVTFGRAEPRARYTELAALAQRLGDAALAADATRVAAGP
jgi:tetratricopeptide (TPR) repeat protein